MTPPRKDLSDTDEREAIRQEEIESVAEQAAEKVLSKSATPVPHYPSKDEVLGLVTSQVSRALREWEGKHMYDCAKDGPACDVKKQLEVRIEAMEKTQDELGKTLGDKIDKLTDKVGGILLESAGNKGEKNVWKVLRIVFVPIVAVAVAWWLNDKSAQRTEASIKRQSEIAATVAKQLLADQARVTPPPFTVAK